MLLAATERGTDRGEAESKRDDERQKEKEHEKKLIKYKNEYRLRIRENISVFLDYFVSFHVLSFTVQNRRKFSVFFFFRCLFLIRLNIGSDNDIATTIKYLNEKFV